MLVDEDTIRLPVAIRASAAHRWFNCPANADFETSRRREGTPIKGEAVASVFGSMVHHELTGHEFVKPRAILYDRITRTERELHRQVEDSVDVLERHIAEKGLTVTSRELELEADLQLASFAVDVQATGHIDLFLQDPSGAVDLCDIKTGHMHPRMAFTQMSVYCWLALAHEIELRDGVVLSLPRGAKIDEEVQELRRPAHDLAMNGVGVLRTAGMLAIEPQATPGLVCSSCENVDCLFHPDGEAEKET